MVLWRPYVWEWATVIGLNIATGVAALVLWNRLADYQKNRLLSFLNPEADPRGAGYQALQSKTAIGSGGWFGSGLTEGPQKRLAFLPEQHTDFVFSVVGEELGFIGVVVALGLFLALFMILVRVARRAADPFSSLVVFGILGLWFTHIFENVGMTINIMPITGIPLPFFSYGGSFFLICSGWRGTRGWLAIMNGNNDLRRRVWRRTPEPTRFEPFPGGRNSRQAHQGLWP
jgi:rod shape determining protein RodA